MMHQVDVLLKVLLYTSLAVSLMSVCPIEITVFDVVGSGQGAIKKRACEIALIYCYLMLPINLFLHAPYHGQRSKIESKLD